ncbi:conserved hypothetical protein [Chelatococcus asaccharovorans]|nr:conserved hypothetical protein [Chelatococcus asaccharovorans]
MFMILVEFPNLTFGLEADIERVPNAKFIPRGAWETAPPSALTCPRIFRIFN